MEISGSYIDWLANLKGFNSIQMTLEVLRFTAVKPATNASSDVHEPDRTRLLTSAETLRAMCHRETALMTMLSRRCRRGIAPLSDIRSRHAGSRDRESDHPFCDANAVVRDPVVAVRNVSGINAQEPISPTPAMAARKRPRSTPPTRSRPRPTSVRSAGRSPDRGRARPAHRRGRSSTHPARARRSSSRTAASDTSRRDCASQPARTWSSRAGKAVLSAGFLAAHAAFGWVDPAGLCGQFPARLRGE